MIVAGMSFSKTAIDAFDEMTVSWQAAEKTRLETARSGLSILNAEALPGHINLVLKNTGQSSIWDYKDWDIIVHYYDAEGNYYIRHLNYVKSHTGEHNQWYCSAIYTDETLTGEEIFQPGIIDPGEVASILLDLLPEAGPETPVWIIIATKSGYATSVQL